MNVLYRGMEHLPDQRITEGMLYIWRAKDLPPRSTSPLLSARYQQSAGLTWIPRGVTWPWWADGIGRMLGDAESPQAMLKAVQDTLKDRSPEEKVRAVVRALDDPKAMALAGPVRGNPNGTMEWDRVASRKEAPAFTKTLLAHLLLRGLGVRTHLVFAASRNLTLLDWRDPNPFRLDASLLFVPDVGEKYLVDIANRSTPLGLAGSDLYSEMFVVDEEGDPPVSFKLWDGSESEVRRLELTLHDDGRLTGSLECAFEGMGLRGIDPWKEGADVAGMVKTALGEGSRIVDTRWAVPTGEMRCYEERPAVLSCEIELEADPFGESGWALHLPSWPLPVPFLDLVAAKDKYPVYIPTGMSFVDTAIIRTTGGEMNVKERPEPVLVRNNAGSLSFWCEEREQGIALCRSLSIYGREDSGSLIDDLVRLCEAWEEVGDRRLHVSAD
jgi:hypothetical protein